MNLKLMKISPNNLTNDYVIAYDEKGLSKIGSLINKTDEGDGIVCRGWGNVMVSHCKYYIKLSDIDKEARKQIKAMKAAEKQKEAAKGLTGVMKQIYPKQFKDM